MLTACPEQTACSPDAWTSAVVGLVRDHRAGVVPGWPDRYSARAVDAVRYLLAESDACSDRIMEGR